MAPAAPCAGVAIWDATPPCENPRMAPDALFPTLLGDEWMRLPEAVRRMHDDAPQVRARGEADVGGATHPLARIARRLLRLPEPGAGQALEFSIERRADRETWTRKFADHPMRSTLTQSGTQLRERLGPVTFFFELRHRGDAIDWQLRGARVLGLPLPRGFFGDVISRSGSDHERYAFEVDVRLPLIGRLVAYRGWLERTDE